MPAVTVVHVDGRGQAWPPQLAAPRSGLHWSRFGDQTILWAAVGAGDGARAALGRLGWACGQMQGRP